MTDAVEKQQRVNLRIENDIAFIGLNRPDKLNAIDYQMFREIDRVSAKLRKNKTIRAAIVYGEGSVFSSGLDVKSVLSQPLMAVKLMFKWLPGQSNPAQRVSSNWRKLPFPVIMALHGKCWGGGLQIALGGDFRIAAPETTLSVMENKWGLIPDMAGNMAMREFMHLDKAMYLAMTAKQIDAQEAHEMNLVSEIADDPMARAIELAEEFKQRSPDAIAAIKKLYHHAWHKNDRDILAKETWYQVKMIAGKNRAIAAVRETKDKTKAFLPRSFQ